MRSQSWIGQGLPQGWVSWTPTLTNISGGTLNYANYIQIGKTVHFRFKYTLAGAGMGSNPRMSLPVTASSAYSANEAIQAGGQFNDATGLRYLPLLLLASTTAADIYYANATPAYASITATVPITWAVNDYINITGTYEAA